MNFVTISRTISLSSLLMVCAPIFAYRSRRHYYSGSTDSLGVSSMESFSDEYHHKGFPLDKHNLAFAGLDEMPERFDFSRTTRIKDMTLEECKAALADLEPTYDYIKNAIRLLSKFSDPKRKGDRAGSYSKYLSRKESLEEKRDELLNNTKPDATPEVTTPASVQKENEGEQTPAPKSNGRALTASESKLLKRINNELDYLERRRLASESALEAFRSKVRRYSYTAHALRKAIKDYAKKGEVTTEEKKKTDDKKVNGKKVEEKKTEEKKVEEKKTDDSGIFSQKNIFIFLAIAAVILIGFFVVFYVLGKTA